MNLHQFVSDTELLYKTHFDKIYFLSYFFYRTEGISEFSIDEIKAWYD